MSILILPKFCCNLHWKQNSRTKNKPQRIQIKCIYKELYFTLVDEASNFILRHLEFSPHPLFFFRHQENAFHKIYRYMDGFLFTKYNFSPLRKM